ncbi:MAG: hypothetical protein RMY29_011885 [Nostoc sp. CreGUA01]|nr:hypothetical protein [Nostoc sp. CreGUA01]
MKHQSSDLSRTYASSTNSWRSWHASCYPSGTPRANKSAEPTAVASSRETRPTHCLPNALARLGGSLRQAAKRLR